MIIHPVLGFKNTIHSEYLNEDILNLQNETFTIPQYYNYTVLEVSNKYIARPDLISYDAYGDAIYTDVICKLNGISNPFELNEGMKLIIPSPEDIHKFNHEAYDDIDLVNNLDLPKPKNKTEKRKANEAIISDKRFKIDQHTGIIIY